jgi:hypothetical protein
MAPRRHRGCVNSSSRIPLADVATVPRAHAAASRILSLGYQCKTAGMENGVSFPVDP